MSDHRTRVFGICSLSLPSFYDRLFALAPDSNINILKHTTEPQDLTGIVLVPSFSLFVSRVKELKAASAVVIFDTPLLLQQAIGIDILDAKRGQFQHSWRLTYVPLDRSLLLKVVRASTKKTKYVDIKAIDLLPRVIEQVKHSSMMDKLLAALYSVTHHKRIIFTKLVTEYLLGFTSKKYFLNQYKKIVPTRGKGKETAFLFLDYLHKPENNRYFQAFGKVGEILQNNQKFTKKLEGVKKKPLSYEKIARKYGVDTYELRYMLKTYRKVERTKISTTVIDEYYKVIGGR